MIGAVWPWLVVVVLSELAYLIAVAKFAPLEGARLNLVTAGFLVAAGLGYAAIRLSGTTEVGASMVLVGAPALIAGVELVRTSILIGKARAGGHGSS